MEQYWINVYLNLEKKQLLGSELQSRDDALEVSQGLSDYIKTVGRWKITLKNRNKA